MGWSTHPRVASHQQSNHHNHGRIEEHYSHLPCQPSAWQTLLLCRLAAQMRSTPPYSANHHMAVSTKKGRTTNHPCHGSCHLPWQLMLLHRMAAWLRIIHLSHTNQDNMDGHNSSLSASTTAAIAAIKHSTVDEYNSSLPYKLPLQ